MVAVIAPAFWGQFGDNVTPGQIKAAMQQLGFAALEEVAVGADLCAVEEAEEFLRMVPEKQPFMATSCCPAWSVMAKKEFPGFAPYISMTMTPMVLTARLQKRRPAWVPRRLYRPAPPKAEASRRSVRSDVDFVITFEELRGMFEAKGIDFSQIPDLPLPLRGQCPRRRLCRRRRRGQGGGGGDPPPAPGGGGQDRRRGGAERVPGGCCVSPDGQV